MSTDQDQLGTAIHSMHFKLECMKRKAEAKHRVNATLIDLHERCSRIVTVWGMPYRAGTLETIKTIFKKITQELDEYESSRREKEQKMDTFREVNKLTFGELKDLDFFIAFPVEGDDHGHGGFKGACNLFQKVPKNPNDPYDRTNAIGVIRRVGTKVLIDGHPTNFPDNFAVIKVGL